MGELVSEETGVLVPPEDPDALAGALRSLLARPAQLVRLGRRAAGRARVEFSLELMAERYGLHYEVAPGHSAVPPPGVTERAIDASSPPA